MAALFTTPKRNDKTSGAHFVEPDLRRRTLLAHGSWRRVTRRIVVGAVCALTVSSLLMPSISLAAEWVDVGGVRHEAAAGPTGDAAGTWSWDGADDMKLNGYNGGAIEAAGKLNVSYEGNNTVTNDDGRGIKVKDGANENAELNIQGDASSTLNVTSSRDAITSVGNINIDGAGTVNATSTEHDAIDAGGDVTIKGSGNVNATGDSDGIRADGNITIDNSGTVTAKATEDQGIDANENLIIKGGGKVEASSIEDNAIWADGSIEISGGSQVKASSEEDAAIDGKNSLTVTNASLNASGVGYGIYVYKGITLDGAIVTVRASSDGGEVSTLFTDEDDIVIKNGSTVDALAEGRFSVAISASNFYSGEAGGHIYISDSVVKAIARYAETGGDGPDHYSGDQNDEIIPESEGLNIGIFAQTSEGITPATISIVRSRVTAKGDTAAIFALAMSADGKAIGTIEIEGATIQTPEGGKVIDYRNKEELSDGIVYEAGQTIGTGDAVIDPPLQRSSRQAHAHRASRGDQTRGKARRDQAGLQVRGREDDQDRCSCSHGSQDRRQTRGNRRRLERSHHSDRPCRNGRYRHRRPGESQTLVNTFSHRTGGSRLLPSPSTSS